MVSGDRFLWTSVGTVPSAVLHFLLGVALLGAAPWLARGVAQVSVSLARAMLSPADHEQLETRVETLQDSRARLVAAADAERRRIERDLHDGAQQRLVSVAMALGRAQNRFADDPEAARMLVQEAHAETKNALAELRDLARGIHPAILVDRGLDAALSALAARCPAPVRVQVGVEPRAPQAVEAAAYFIVAEALANVAKHAHATQAWVTARRADDVLHLSITDDGVGGADPHGGTGLAGLRDRVQAVDGTFMLTSPPGGVTTITVELPCVS
jgi:signal transduction histidine kinase